MSLGTTHFPCHHPELSLGACRVVPELQYLDLQSTLSPYSFLKLFKKATLTCNWTLGSQLIAQR